MLSAVNQYLNAYSREISDSIFDPDRIFTNPNVDYMLEIYNTDSDSDVYVGNEVDEDGIYIPAKKTSSEPSVTEPAETENIGAEETEPIETEETDSEETEPLETEPSETEPDGNNDNEEFDE